MTLAEKRRWQAHRRLEIVDRRLRRVERLLRWAITAAAAAAAGHGVGWFLP